ncbi:Hypothetical predicted protein [Paramuricea clavata]|uniref:Uncharacterized protein n=1 Tax=Paramuricea clavata TaxID=317549 RepID=A0A7D9E2C9_PARCT|nr:Hypothetical predicted protein [Paramuricea clavata]
MNTPDIWNILSWECFDYLLLNGVIKYIYTCTTVKRSGGEKEKQKENGCGSEDEDGSEIKDGSEYTPSIIAPTTSTKSSQQLLSNEDSVLFLTVFDELINSSRQITKAVVYDKLRAQPKLSHLEKQ